MRRPAALYDIRHLLTAQLPDLPGRLRAVLDLWVEVTLLGLNGRQDTVTLVLAHGLRGPRSWGSGQELEVERCFAPLQAVVVYPAGLQDRDGAKLVLQQMGGLFPDLCRLWADSGYAGALQTWVAEHTPCALGRICKDPQAQGFAVLPKSWIVEQTFAWLGPVAYQARRLTKDYEARPDTSEAWIDVAMIDRIDLKSFHTRSKRSVAVRSSVYHTHYAPSPGCGSLGRPANPHHANAHRAEGRTRFILPVQWLLYKNSQP